MGKKTYTNVNDQDIFDVHKKLAYARMLRTLFLSPEMFSIMNKKRCFNTVPLRNCAWIRKCH